MVSLHGPFGIDCRLVTQTSPKLSETWEANIKMTGMILQHKHCIDWFDVKIWSRKWVWTFWFQKLRWRVYVCHGFLFAFPLSARVVALSWCPRRLVVKKGGRHNMLILSERTTFEGEKVPLLRRCGWRLRFLAVEKPGLVLLVLSSQGQNSITRRESSRWQTC